MSLLAKPSPKRGALFGVLNALGRLFVALAVLLCAHVPIAMLFGERPATLGFVLAAVVSGVIGAALLAMLTSCSATSSTGMVSTNSPPWKPKRPRRASQAAEPGRSRLPIAYARFPSLLTSW